MAHAQGSCQETRGPCIESIVGTAVGPKKFPVANLQVEHRQSSRGASDQKAGGTFKLTENCKSYKEESDLPALGKFSLQG